MKKQYALRSIRVEKALLDKAKKKSINVNDLISETLRQLLDGQSTCPVCSSVLKKKPVAS